METDTPILVTVASLTTSAAHHGPKVKPRVCGELPTVRFPRWVAEGGWVGAGWRWGCLGWGLGCVWVGVSMPNDFTVQRYRKLQTTYKAIKCIFCDVFLSEISKVPLQILHKIVNPYMAKYALYEVLKCDDILVLWHLKVLVRRAQVVNDATRITIVLSIPITHGDQYFAH